MISEDTNLELRENVYGVTPIFLAAALGHTDVMTKLLQSGA